MTTKKPSKLTHKLCVLLSSFITSICFANNINIIGKAYGKNQQLVYTEEYALASIEEILVTYKEPNGEVFAEKNLDFSRSLSAPSLTQRNDRIGELIEVNFENNEIESLYRMNADKNKTVKTIALKADEDLGLVIDAGFDNFIRIHWHQLIDGEKVELLYFLPTNQILVNLLISKSECQAYELEDKEPWQMPASMCLKISPASWWLRLLVKPLYLTYDENQRLLIFQGRSNIADAKGKYQNVNIHYQYFENKNP